MLKNFWYPCEFSKRIRRDPVQVFLLGEEMVLFRNRQGQVQALGNQCPHRGDRLSLGYVEGDCLRCPFHAWAFDGSGACVDIPSNPPDMSISPKARVESYPVQEKFGLVWVFFGDVSPDVSAPIPDFPEYELRGWRPVYFDTYVKAHYTRCIENGVDISHLPFLHRGTYGDHQKVEYDLVDLVNDEWSCSVTYRHTAQVPPGPLRLIYPKPLETETRFSVYMPNITRTAVKLRYGNMILFMAHVPIRTDLTRLMYVVVRDFNRFRLADEFVAEAAMQIVREDLRSLENQRPRRVPYRNADELHVKIDRFPLIYRRMRKACMDKGWSLEDEVLG